jgi:hypothetical protein
MTARIVKVALVSCIALGTVATAQSDTEYLRWSRSQAENIGRGLRVNGRVGGLFDLRVVHTEHSYNYKLRATWLTPEVVRASARMAQLSQGLTDQQTIDLVKEADDAGDVTILVEIDPREGSGVIPLDWVALLQTKSVDGSVSASAVKGTNTSNLRNAKALAGVFRRDYDYEPFWVVFRPDRDQATLLASPSADQAELIVRIHNKEGRVVWKLPPSVKTRLSSTLAK